MSGQPDSDCNCSYQLVHCKSPWSFVSKPPPGRVVECHPPSLRPMSGLRGLFIMAPRFPLRNSSFVLSCSTIRQQGRYYSATGGTDGTVVERSQDRLLRGID